MLNVDIIGGVVVVARIYHRKSHLHKALSQMQTIPVWIRFIDMEKSEAHAIHQMPYDFVCIPKSIILTEIFYTIFNGNELDFANTLYYYINISAMSFNFLFFFLYFSRSVYFFHLFSLSLFTVFCSIWVFNDCLEGKKKCIIYIESMASMVVCCTRVSVNNQDVRIKMNSSRKNHSLLMIIKYRPYFSFYVVLCNLIASFHILWFSLNYPASLVP